MGCDIHCFVEYKAPNSKYWASFGGEMRPGRHYGVFAGLADVRNWDSSGIEPVAECRGVPTDLGYAAESSYTMWVSSDADDGLTEGYCTKEAAEKWVASGQSTWVDKNHTRVTDPDAHSGSWVTADELYSVLTNVNVDAKVCEEPKYYAMYTAMKAFELQHYECRLVFWFDN